MAMTSSATFGAPWRQHGLRAGLSQEALPEQVGANAYGVRLLEPVCVAPHAEMGRLLTADALRLDTPAPARLIAAAHLDLAAPPQRPPGVRCPLGLILTIPARIEAAIGLGLT